MGSPSTRSTRGAVERRLGRLIAGGGLMASRARRSLRVGPGKWVVDAQKNRLAIGSLHSRPIGKGRCRWVLMTWEGMTTSTKRPRTGQLGQVTLSCYSGSWADR